MRKTKKRNSIKRLAHGAAIPDWEPKRYINSRGYVSLRWQVGDRKYLEVAEHRLACGLPPTGYHVHHRNGVKTDNCPENLEVLTTSHHLSRHSKRKIDDTEAADLYRAGWTLTAIGDKFGVHHTNVMHALKRQGIQRRSWSDYAWRCDHITGAIIAARHFAGYRVPSIAREFGTTDMIMRRVFRELGLTPHRSGRPPAALCCTSARDIHG